MKALEIEEEGKEEIQNPPPMKPKHPSGMCAEVLDCNPAGLSSTAYLLVSSHFSLGKI